MEELWERAPLVVAEVGQAHDGSLGTAHAFVDAIAEAGADVVKLQTHLAAAESTLDEPWRVRFSPQDETRYEYWRRMEFTPEQWAGLADHARARGLGFASSPFSVEAVQLLDALAPPFWKIASGEVTHQALLEAVWETGRPVILSSGMSRLEELDRAVEGTRARGLSVAVLQCTSAYPCPPERWGLEQLAELRARYGCPVGLSDHSGNVAAGLAACALGAEVLEVHVTLHRQAFGPDVPASLTPDELADLVAGARDIRRALDHPVDKDGLAEELGELRATFGRSVALARDLPAGTPLQDADLRLKKPGGGIPEEARGRLLGRRLARDVTADRLLTWDDLEAV